MASAAKRAGGDLLLQYLRVNGWRVDLRAAGGAVSVVATREGLRNVGWAKTRTAAAVLMFSHACLQRADGRATLS